MADDRPSIEEILAMARSQDGGSADTPAPAEAEAAPPAEETAPAAETSEETPEAKPSKPATPAAKPSGVSDILAMARAQDSGGAAETPAADTPAKEAAAEDDAPSSENPASFEGPTNIQ